MVCIYEYTTHNVYELSPLNILNMMEKRPLIIFTAGHLSIKMGRKEIPNYRFNALN